MLLKNIRKKHFLMALTAVGIISLCTGCGSGKGAADQGENTEAEKLSNLAYPVSVNYVEGGIDAEGKWIESNEVLRTYHFDDKGHPVSCDKVDQGEKIEDTYENSYREDGSLEKVVARVGYYDEDAAKVTYEKYIREYDEEERLVGRNFQGWVEKYSYNQEGLLTRLETNLEGDEANKTVLEYTYKDRDDQDGSMVCEVKEYIYTDSKVTDEFDDRIITYNQDGFISKVEYVEADGIPEWDYDYEMENGLVTKVIQHYEDSESYTYSFTYDDSNPALDMTGDHYKEYINGVFDDVM